MSRFRTNVLTMVLAGVFGVLPATADQPKSLLQRIAEWQYPGSEIHDAVMQDAATVNAQGERTVPSIQCKTVLTTKDDFQTVVQYYESKLNPAATRVSTDEDKPMTGGRSVTVQTDSNDRPMGIHILVVNTAQQSTTLVISRANTESETHIAWTQYQRLPIPERP